jgi:hypothetical protein
MHLPGLKYGRGVVPKILALVDGPAVMASFISSIDDQSIDRRRKDQLIFPSNPLHRTPPESVSGVSLLSRRCMITLGTSTCNRYLRMFPFFPTPFSITMAGYPFAKTFALSRREELCVAASSHGFYWSAHMRASCLVLHLE